MMEVTVVYNDKPESVVEVTGVFIPASGPLSEFVVLTVKDGYLAIAPHRIITMKLNDIPEVFRIDTDFIHMSKQMSVTMMQEEFRQMENKNAPENTFQ